MTLSLTRISDSFVVAVYSDAPPYVDVPNLGRVHGLGALVNGWVDQSGLYTLVTDPPPAATLASAKVLKYSVLAAAYDTSLAGGFVFNTKSYDLRPPQRAYLSLLYAKAVAIISGQSGETWPVGLTYPANDGTETAVATAAGFKTAFASAVAYCTTADKNYRTILAAINAAGSISAVQAVSTSSGWPG